MKIEDQIFKNSVNLIMYNLDGDRIAYARGDRKSETEQFKITMIKYIKGYEIPNKSEIYVRIVHRRDDTLIGSISGADLVWL